MDGDSHDALIAAIYDAALDPGLWPGILTRLRAATAASGSVLFLNRAGKLIFTAFDGFDPSLTARLPEVQDQDEYLKRRRAVPVLRPVRGGELIPYDEFRRTAFFHEFAKPVGSARLCGATLIDDADRLAAISVFRPDGAEEFDSGVVRFLAGLAPHFRRAIAIMDRIDAAQGRAAHRAQVLDHLSAAAIAVDAAGRLLHWNMHAEALLAQEDGLVRHAEHIAGRGGDNAETLRVLLARAGAAHQPQAASGTIRRRTGPPLQVWAVPARAGAGGLLPLQPDPCVLLILREAPRSGAPPRALLQSVYGLTPAEARLACALAEGAALADVAAQAGITLNTVRAQLKSVFRKTDTRRQSELVRLMTLSALAPHSAPLGRPEP